MRGEQGRRTWRSGCRLTACGDRVTVLDPSRARLPWAITMADCGRFQRQARTASRLGQRMGTSKERANTSPHIRDRATRSSWRRSSAHSAAMLSSNAASLAASACTVWGVARRFVRAVHSTARYRGSVSRHGISRMWRSGVALHWEAH
jgi:hypothetical protein